MLDGDDSGPPGEPGRRETQPISVSDLAKKHAVSRQHFHQTLRSLPNPEWAQNTWRGTPSRGPSYSEFSTSPTI
jgi:hypothetical protein